MSEREPEHSTDRERFADKVGLLPNTRRSDNYLQAGITGLFTIYGVLSGLETGSVLYGLLFGLIGGLIVSGIIIMVIGLFRK